MRQLFRIATFSGMLIVLSTKPGKAQELYGSNTFEFQYGNLPYEENRDLTTSYDQLNLFFDYDRITVYGKLEQFLTPKKDRNYFELTQKRVQYQDDIFRIRVGNFYETIGRGLLLRSYDIPGSVYEDAFERTRYAFFRDLEGVAIDVTTDIAELKVLRAEPLYNPFPPNFKPDSLRRPDLVEAVQANFFLADVISFGGAVMRSNSIYTDDFEQYGSVMFTANPTYNLQFFGEYAFNTEAAFSFDDNAPFALYSGMNFYFDSFGGSFEYKNYNNFRLGQGAYNDPPSLIKEHTYPLLNRSTHVLETSGEKGIQLEAYYNFEAGHAITANVTTATNGPASRFEYREYFLEGLYQVDDFLSFKSFMDYANDDLKGEENRITLGLITDKSFDYTWGVVLDLQFQTLERPFEDNSTQNYFASLTFSRSPDFSVSALFELTTDPQLIDNPTTGNVESDPRTWFGGNISYDVNSNNRIDLFAGKRRGGPACTSGICYEILDFEGFELRMTTRF